MRNFETQYETFVADSVADCEQLKLDPRELVKIQIDVAPLTQIRSKAQEALNEDGAAKNKNREDSTALKTLIDELTQQLDAPNVSYQQYLQQLQDWQRRRDEIVGGKADSGSFTHIAKQIQDHGQIPKLLKAREVEREAKTRDIYGELQQLVSQYKSLYDPVQKFIQEHGLSAGKFTFEFEASITCTGFAAGLFTHINQNKMGSFRGAEEGLKLANNLVATADFGSVDGVIAFAETIMDHLTHDRRSSTPQEVAVQANCERNAQYSKSWTTSSR